MEQTPFGERPSYISHKGHEFILTLYHFPSSCEVCARPLWHVFKPPPALECRRCHTKCHKDHLDKKEEVIVPCKGQCAPAPEIFTYWGKSSINLETLGTSAGGSYLSK